MYVTDRDTARAKRARGRGRPGKGTGTGRALQCTVVYREIETAVPDERVPVLFVLHILSARSYNIKVNYIWSQ